MMGKWSQFDRALEKATSRLLLEPDWDATLQICDSIRQGDVQPKTALIAIRKKIVNDNPHVANYALQVLESAVKNCGSIVQTEIATKEFMEFMKEQAKARSDPVKGKVLELIQVWSHAFRNITAYRAVTDMYHLMKAEEFKFPVLKESDAMFSAERAPEWKDGECCHRCRVQFGMVNRKHHCRNCGQIFCGKCTGKTSIIPKYGIEKEVRVCDSCHDMLVKPSSASTSGKKSSADDDLPTEYLNSTLSQQSQTPPSKNEQDLREEEELQLALALSQSEAESKAKEQRERMRTYGYTTRNEPTSSTNSTNSTSSSATGFAPMIDTSDMDPELARYLNRNYWEKKKEKLDSASTSIVTTTAPSAPAAQTEPKYASVSPKPQEVCQNDDVDSREQFLNALRSSIEIFVNRMKSNSSRGRNIANDSSVQTLFLTINQMHPELTKYLQEQEDLRTFYEDLQDKLAQLKDAREALDALRADHMEKRRLEEEEAEKQRQRQMMLKLEVMRQKKQEYLEYQRMLAQQRLEEQERELQQRLEQHKQLAQMRQMQQYGYAQMYGPQLAQPTSFSPGGSAEGSPIHHFQQGGAVYQQAGVGPASMPAMMAPGPQSMGYQYQQPHIQGQYASPNMPNQGAPVMPNQGYWPNQTCYPAQQGYQLAYNQGPPQVAPAAYAVVSNAGQGPEMYGSQAQGQEQYQSFDMQNMAGALPQQPQSTTGMPIQGAPQQGYDQTAYQSQQRYQTNGPQHSQDQLITFD